MSRCLIQQQRSLVSSNLLSTDVMQKDSYPSMDFRKINQEPIIISKQNKIAYFRNKNRNIIQHNAFIDNHGSNREQIFRRAYKTISENNAIDSKKQQESSRKNRKSFIDCDFNLKFKQKGIFHPPLPRKTKTQRKSELNDFQEVIIAQKGRSQKMQRFQLNLSERLQYQTKRTVVNKKYGFQLFRKKKNFSCVQEAKKVPFKDNKQTAISSVEVKDKLVYLNQQSYRVNLIFQPQCGSRETTKQKIAKQLKKVKKFRKNSRKDILRFNQQIDSKVTMRKDQNVQTCISSMVLENTENSKKLESIVKQRKNELNDQSLLVISQKQIKQRVGDQYSKRVNTNYSMHRKHKSKEQSNGQTFQQLPRQITRVTPWEFGLNIEQQGQSLNLSTFQM